MSQLLFMPEYFSAVLSPSNLDSSCALYW